MVPDAGARARLLPGRAPKGGSPPSSPVSFSHYRQHHAACPALPTAADRRRHRAVLPSRPPPLRVPLLVLFVASFHPGFADGVDVEGGLTCATEYGIDFIVVKGGVDCEEQKSILNHMIADCTGSPGELECEEVDAAEGGSIMTLSAVGGSKCSAARDGLRKAHKVLTFHEEGTVDCVEGYLAEEGNCAHTAKWMSAAITHHDDGTLHKCTFTSPTTSQTSTATSTVSSTVTSSVSSTATSSISSTATTSITTSDTSTGTSTGSTTGTTTASSTVVTTVTSTRTSTDSSTATSSVSTSQTSTGTSTGTTSITSSATSTVTTELRGRFKCEKSDKSTLIGEQFEGACDHQVGTLAALAKLCGSDDDGNDNAATLECEDRGSGVKLKASKCAQVVVALNKAVQEMGYYGEEDNYEPFGCFFGGKLTWNTGCDDGIKLLNAAIEHKHAKVSYGRVCEHTSPSTTATSTRTSSLTSTASSSATTTESSSVTTTASTSATTSASSSATTTQSNSGSSTVSSTATTSQSTTGTTSLSSTATTSASSSATSSLTSTASSSATTSVSFTATTSATSSLKTPVLLPG